MLCVGCFLLTHVVLIAGFDHMNGEYHFANQKPGQQAMHRGSSYFDVISPEIQSVYSQVSFDTHQVPLDPTFVKKHDGKTINIVGYEFDMVRINENGEQVSVPAWEQYNHHYGNNVLGKGATLVNTGILDDHQAGCMADETKAFTDGYKIVSTDNGTRAAPPAFSNAPMIMGNGAESRKTFHFIPPGYGMMVTSPNAWVMRAMVIDTMSRNGTATPNETRTQRRARTGHGPLPYLANPSTEEMYSGLHECPCTDRYPKHITDFTTENQGSCKVPVTTPEACFGAAAELGLQPVKANLTMNSSTKLSGCSVQAISGGFEVVFNTGESRVSCGTQPKQARVVGMAESFVNISVDLQPEEGPNGTARIVLTGPADVWFGVGFGASDASGGTSGREGLTMMGTPWTIVVLPTGVQERKLADHAMGTELTPTIQVVKNTVVNGKRTVVITRPMQIGNFNFNATANKIGYINAVGSTPYFAEHKDKASDDLYLVETAAPTCLCRDGTGQGTIGGYAWGAQRCVARPFGQMLDDPYWESNGRINPSCLLKSYRGGLRCCRNKAILLDKNQTVPAEVDRYHLKCRFYFEEVEDTNKVTQLNQIGWWTEHNNNEHDFPKCKPGETCEYIITSNFTAGEMTKTPATLIHMEGHCHIGCYRMEMWIMDDPAHPKLLCRTNVTYGSGDGWMDEMGYIGGNEPCIFGHAKDGFEPPIVLNSTTKLMSIQVANNTNAHYGDMGLWEILGATVTGDETLQHEHLTLV